MMNLRRKLLALLICILFIGSMPGDCRADGEYSVFTQTTGSLTITFRENQTPVPGGSVSVYQVAFYDPDSSDHSLIIREEFDDCQATAEEPDMELLAKLLAEHAAKKHLEGTHLQINQDAVAKLENLELGIYLVVQTEAAKGYEAVNPFLVTVPMKDGDQLIYDVDASPKVTTQKKPDQPDTPEHHTPGNPPSYLPKTGQLWWPVPVLVILGLSFCIIGWKKKNKS